MNKIMHIFVLLLSLFSIDNALGQESHNEHHSPIHTYDNVHTYGNTIRIAGFIGHTLIKSEGSNSHLFIPSWGIDLEYWISNSWGIGLHNDVEVESFVIRNNEHEEIERINPIVITIDGLYHLKKGVILSGGPGIELEHGESYYLIRLGIEYEKEIGNGFDISPTLFSDHRFDGFSTWTIALGVGKRF